jgi:excisionase family DNA binding protein
MKELLTPADIAPQLGVTTGRIYQLIRAGIIPTVRVAGGIRIPRETWERWLAEQDRKARESMHPDYAA